MRPKPRNLQFHTRPGLQKPPKMAPNANKNLQVIMGQANTSITNLHGRGAGKTLVVCGNGPSISDAPLEKLKGAPDVEFLAINVPDHRVWPTQYWILQDSVNMMRPECFNFMPSYQGIVITNHIVKKNVSFRHLVRVVIHRGGGISRDMLRGLCMGASSGYVALQVALYMGFKDIYFFGIDMAPSKDGEMWSFGENTGISEADRQKKFSPDAEFWDKGADLLTPEERAHIYICSTVNPWSFTKKFNQLSPEEGVEKILGTETASPAEPAKPEPEPTDSEL